MASVDRTPINTNQDELDILNRWLKEINDHRISIGIAPYQDIHIAFAREIADVEVGRIINAGCKRWQEFYTKILESRFTYRHRRE